jgi:hypothetical protein
MFFNEKVETYLHFSYHTSFLKGKTPQEDGEYEVHTNEPPYIMKCTNTTFIVNLMLYCNLQMIYMMSSTSL